MNANDFSINYVSAILVGTPQAELVTPQMPKRLKGAGRSHCPSGARAFTIARSDIADPRFARQDLLHLTVVKEYLLMLIINDGVARPESIEAAQALIERSQRMMRELFRNSSGKRFLGDLNQIRMCCIPI